MNANIVLLPGDGIGPEIVNETRLVLDAVAKLFGHTFSYSTHLLGGCAIDATGTAMPEATLKACQASDAVLLGAVGGPKIVSATRIDYRRVPLEAADAPDTAGAPASAGRTAEEPTP